MKTQHFTFPPSGQTRATVTLPLTLGSDALGSLERSLGTQLRELRGETGVAPAGEPGVIEFDSWLAQLRSAR